MYFISTEVHSLNIFLPATMSLIVVSWKRLTSLLNKQSISLIKENKLAIGPYFVSADSYLVNFISMLKNLKTPIVAEGVETNEQVKFLTDLNCDLAQGFLYYKPLKDKDFKALLPNENKETEK